MNTILEQIIRSQKALFILKHDKDPNLIMVSPALGDYEYLYATIEKSFHKGTFQTRILRDSYQESDYYFRIEYEPSLWKFTAKPAIGDICQIPYTLLHTPKYKVGDKVFWPGRKPPEDPPETYVIDEVKFASFETRMEHYYEMHYEGQPSSYASGWESELVPHTPKSSTLSLPTSAKEVALLLK